MTLTITLPRGEALYSGKQVTFQTPCESEGLTGLVVDNVTYALVNAMGTALVGNSFDTGSMVSVIFDLEAKKAYVQNADTNAYLEGKFNKKLDKSGGTMTGELKAAGTTKYTTALVRNIVSGSASELGAVGSKTSLPNGTIIIYTS